MCRDEGAASSTLNEAFEDLESMSKEGSVFIMGEQDTGTAKAAEAPQEADEGYGEAEDMD